MSFVNARLPTNFERGIQAYPSRWSTTLHPGVSGKEHGNQNWTIPVGRWQTGYPEQSLSGGDINIVRTMHMVMKGRLHHFLLKVLGDHVATDERMATIGGGSYQLQRYHVLTLVDATTTVATRKITRPVASTIVVKVDGVVTGGWTHTGLGVLTGLPGSGVVTASFEFDYPVRFDTDALPLRVVRATEGIHVGVMGIAPFDLIEVLE